MAAAQRKRIAVLGSTGSIGTQALDVIRHDERFHCFALAAGSNTELLNEQIAEFSPKYVGIANADSAHLVNTRGAELFAGSDAAELIAVLNDVDIVMNGISGFCGTAPLISALNAKKTVALANKESIVCAHAIVDEAIKRGGAILPVDSEQSAIFQCLAAGRKCDVKRLILTASGGAFRDKSIAELKNVTPEQACVHPTWSMGRKITIDSASLFNKGLEIMEASYLFGVTGENIDVLIHPQSIVHSMVEYNDSSVIAQLSVPDMRLAIQYALNYPERIGPAISDRLELGSIGSLTFAIPDRDKYPALPLAYAALNEGNALPIAYNGANEAAVNMFINGEIGFLDIAARVEYAMEKIDAQRFEAVRCMDDIRAIDAIARAYASEIK